MISELQSKSENADVKCRINSCNNHSSQRIYSDSNAIAFNADLSDEDSLKLQKLQTLEQYFSHNDFITQFTQLGKGLQLCINCFSTSIYFIFHVIRPLSDELFCQINLMVSIFAGTSVVTQYLTFCSYSKKEQFQGIARKKLPFILNAISWFTMISETLITKFFHQHGLSLLAIINQSIILDLI
ncbi:unnamed protein product [Paramecium pentaurelia]|uniref:Uncharacterized protein n=1 Tax=Paramecium pentaurelia TaxID=43138 RepID=A0A8S1VT42_9CILI|nr:unnamed protein product [Paramecium pentaurelia]